MNPTLLLLIKVLVASLIVGFVSASIKSWVDRVFLVILLIPPRKLISHGYLPHDDAWRGVDTWL